MAYPHYLGVRMRSLLRPLTGCPAVVVDVRIALECAGSCAERGVGERRQVRALALAQRADVGLPGEEVAAGEQEQRRDQQEDAEHAERLDVAIHFALPGGSSALLSRSKVSWSCLASL